MSTIIHLPVREAHPDRDTEARKRADRLNRAITEEMQAALAFLSMIDPDAFDVAFQAVPPNLDDLPDVDGPEPFCGRCGVAIFPGQGETWQHYRGWPSSPANRRSPARLMSRRSSGTSPMRPLTTADPR